MSPFLYFSILLVIGAVVLIMARQGRSRPMRAILRIVGAVLVALSAYGLFTSFL
ncbi:MAG: hypothetical protein J5927_01450 [Oscillospiraceae bacterium]|nr:hypothetical protein [Oscillospiraceae bacterium]